jgi:sec-independent protein translocase protein TatC
MIFQMPLLIIILSRIGIVSYDFLSEKRRFIVVGLFIFSAILTPPDPASQIIVVIPLYILFELSLFIIKIFK